MIEVISEGLKYTHTCKRCTTAFMYDIEDTFKMDQEDTQLYINCPSCRVANDHNLSIPTPKCIDKILTKESLTALARQIQRRRLH